MADLEIPCVKVVVLGDSGVGKTTFMKRHLTGEFEKRHVETVGCDIFELLFHTSCGPIKFSMWDTAGAEKFGGLRSGYYTNANYAMIMFSVDNRSSYKNVPLWYRDYIKVNPQGQACLIGNKTDVKARKIPTKSIQFHRKKNLGYFDVSAKSNFNFEKPFLYLARKYFRQTDLFFVQALPLRHPETLTKHMEANVQEGTCSDREYLWAAVRDHLGSDADSVWIADLLREDHGDLPLRALLGAIAASHRADPDVPDTMDSLVRIRPNPGVAAVKLKH